MDKYIKRISDATPIGLTFYQSALTRKGGVPLGEVAFAELSFEDLSSWKVLSEPIVRKNKIKCPGFSRANTEGARLKANTTGPYLVVLDFDKVPHSLGCVSHWLEGEGISHIGHSTHSHGKLLIAGLHSFRVITDFSAETWGEVADITDQISALFPIECKPAPESATSLFWFGPAIHPRWEDAYEWVAYDDGGSAWSPERNVEAVAAIDAPRPKARREPVANLDIDEIESALEAIPNENLHYDKWMEIGMALHDTGVPEALDLWQDWSAKSWKHEAEYCEGKWDTFNEGKDDAVTLGTVFHYAKANGWEGHIHIPEPSGEDDFDDYVPEAERDDDDEEPTEEERVEERVRWRTCLDGQNRRGLIRLFNERFAYVMASGMVLDAGLGSVSFIKSAHFKDAFIHPMLAHPTMMKNDQPVMESAGKIWFGAEARRTYESIDFLPPGGPDSLGPDTFNQWRGFAFEPEEGNGHLRLLEHIFENVCSGDDTWAHWIVAWMAHIVQRPWEKPGTALVLRSDTQGTGKGVVLGTIRALCGDHGIRVGRSEQMFGRFNAWMYGKVFVFADEVTWGGNKDRGSALKGLITDTPMTYEEKGVPIFEAGSYQRLGIASNNDWAVPVETSDRRFQVFDVGTKHEQDKPYFIRLVRDLRRGGYANLMHYLVNLDLSDFPDPTTTITTAALIRQKLESLDSVDAWMYNVLTNGTFGISDDWPETVAKRTVFGCYLEAAKESGVGRRSQESHVGRRLKKAFGSGLRLRRTRNGEERVRSYEFPPLDMARKLFETNVLRGPVDWPEEGDE